MTDATKHRVLAKLDQAVAAAQPKDGGFLVPAHEWGALCAAIWDLAAEGDDE